MRFGPPLFRLARLYSRVIILVEIPGRELDWPAFIQVGPHSSTMSTFTFLYDLS